MPATEDVLLLYVSYLYRQGLSYNTIQVYLYSIRSLHIFHGYNNPLQHCLRLNQIVKAVHISSGVAKQKLPITVELLRKLQPIVSTFNDGSMLWTAMLLAFFGCLRASEFTVNSSFSPSVHLSIGDVSFSHIDDHPYAVVIIKQSKTDTFNKGVSVYIGCTGDCIMCAHCSLKLIVAKQSGSYPLFAFSNGAPLSKYVFIRCTRLALSLLGYPCDQYSGHSFRSGSATTAATVGMSDYEIKLLGRWSSDAYHRYIRAPVPLLATFSKRLCTNIKPII